MSGYTGIEIDLISGELRLRIGADYVDAFVAELEELEGLCLETQCAPLPGVLHDLHRKLRGVLGPLAQRRLAGSTDSTEKIR